MPYNPANVPQKREERPTLAAALDRVREAVAEACRDAGRSPSTVRVVAVAKFHLAQEVRGVVESGLLDIGENRVQEAEEKQPQVTGAIWHMVGRLQRNKAARAAALFDWLHSLDRAELIRPLAVGAARREKPLNVLVQVSLAGEEQKGGCLPSEVGEIVAALAAEPMLRVRGLMTVPPADRDPRPYFARLRDMLETLRAEGAPPGFDQLSMGMSSDFAAAIAEGATMVRIGTMIFGPRGG